MASQEAQLLAMLRRDLTPELCDQLALVLQSVFGALSTRKHCKRSLVRPIKDFEEDLKLFNNKHTLLNTQTLQV